MCADVQLYMLIFDMSKEKNNKESALIPNVVIRLKRTRLTKSKAYSETQNVSPKS